MNTILSFDFNRAGRLLVLSTAFVLGGCAVTHTNLNTCGDTTTRMIGGELAAIKISTGGGETLNEDCLKAKQVATIVFMRNENGSLSPYALKFGEIYHSKAEPKVRAFFDKYLAAKNYTASDLSRLGRELSLPVEVQLAHQQAPDPPSDNPEKKKTILFVCRVHEDAKRCRYEEAPTIRP